MPLRKGSSKEVREENFHELRHGPTYARTARKYGSARAQSQMEAIVLSNERKALGRDKKKDKSGKSEKSGKSGNKSVTKLGAKRRKPQRKYTRYPKRYSSRRRERR